VKKTKKKPLSSLVCEGSPMDRVGTMVGRITGKGFEFQVERVGAMDDESSDDGKDEFRWLG